MVGSYSCVHCERTNRRVIEDLPQPPSPQIVIVMRWGSEEEGEEREDAIVGRRGRAVFAVSLFLLVKIWREMRFEFERKENCLRNARSEVNVLYYLGVDGRR